MLCLYIFAVCLVFFTKSQILKPGPSFSHDTIKKAENIILYDNIPLNTGKIFLRIIFFVNFLIFFRNFGGSSVYIRRGISSYLFFN